VFPSQPSRVQRTEYVLEPLSNVDYWTKVNTEFTDAARKRR
jgi:hypothetical protein